MGTFHQHRGELHGTTVVVETDGPELYVGRYDLEDEHGLVLRDVGVHRQGQDALSREEYLRRAAAHGVWKQHDSLILPLNTVLSIRRLGDL